MVPENATLAPDVIERVHLALRPPSRTQVHDDRASHDWPGRTDPQEAQEVLREPERAGHRDLGVHQRGQRADHRDRGRFPAADSIGATTREPSPSCPSCG